LNYRISILKNYENLYKNVLDTDNNLIEEEYYYYTGPMAFAGIHYDFKSSKGN